MITKAHQILNELVTETKRMKTGEPPRAMKILGIQAELIEVYVGLGMEMNMQFSAKEQAYLQRKVAMSNSHLASREKKMTVKDSEMTSIVDAWDQYAEEIEASSKYENYRTLLRAVDKGIEHARSVVSFLKTSEANA